MIAELFCVHREVGQAHQQVGLTLNEFMLALLDYFKAENLLIDRIQQANYQCG